MSIINIHETLKFETTSTQSIHSTCVFLMCHSICTFAILHGNYNEYCTACWVFAQGVFLLRLSLCSVLYCHLNSTFLLNAIKKTRVFDKRNYCQFLFVFVLKTGIFHAMKAKANTNSSSIERSVDLIVCFLCLKNDNKNCNSIYHFN